VGPARWNAWLKLGLYIVGAPPLATPFTVELTIVDWLKKKTDAMRMRCALAIKVELISASVKDA